MEILKWKSTAAETENSLEGINSKFQLAKELMRGVFRSFRINFTTILPSKNTDLDNQSWTRVPLWKSRGLSGFSMLGPKNIQDWIH